MNSRLIGVVGAFLVAGAMVAGCSGSGDTNKPPVPTTAATDDNGNNANVTVPNVVGSNAQSADDILRKAGFVNIKYGTADTTQTVDPAHLADWKVTATDPASGAVVASNSNIVVTVVKQ